MLAAQHGKSTCVPVAKPRRDDPAPHSMYRRRDEVVRRSGSRDRPSTPKPSVNRLAACLHLGVRTAKWTASFAIGLVFLWGGTNSAGVCLRPPSFLSDTDYVRRAVREEAAWIGIPDTAEAADQFIRLHPDCCTVSRIDEGGSRRVLDRVLASYAATVELSFDLGAQEAHFLQAKRYHAFVELSPCGQKTRYYGESFNTNKP